MLPNTSAYLKPDTAMTDRAFALLLKRHFGVKVSSDLSPLTTEDYEKYMTDIRISYVYSFLQAINKNTLETVIEKTSKASEAELDASEKAIEFAALQSSIKERMKRLAT